MSGGADIVSVCGTVVGFMTSSRSQGGQGEALVLRKGRTAQWIGLRGEGQRSTGVKAGCAVLRVAAFE